MSKLNAEQQRAVDCETDLLVLAPPGSGKTGTLVAKTKRIVQDNPNSFVMLVTFTDASAKEARERITKALSPSQAKRVLVNTFHSHAIDQLRRSEQLGRILAPHESTEMVVQALREVASSLPVEEAEAFLQAKKATPDFTGTEADFIAAYEAKKRMHRAIDLQDVTRESINGMRAGTVKPIPATHVLCDEFQDVDWNQLYWLLCYKNAGAVITVVGDDDQSVYGWRNSLGYTAVQEFIRMVSPEVINLEVNYRSHVEILQNAVSVIRHNTQRMDKNIVSQVGPGGEVEVFMAANKELEADQIVKRISEDVEESPDGRKRVPNGRWGIIARGNRDLWIIATKLRQAGIPFVKSTKRDAAPYEVMALCGLLTALQTGDSFGLRQGLSAAGISDSTIRKIHERTGDEFFAIMDGELPDLSGIELEESRALKEFVRLTQIWRKLVAEGRYKRVIGAVGHWFLDGVVKGDDAKEDFETFVEMLEKARGTLTVRIMNFFRQEESKAAAGVALHTMHGSKGLEFDRVFVAECNKGTIPSSKSVSVEEERRLFYVAMTRARKQLIMGYIASKGKSPFLEEICALGA